MKIFLDDMRNPPDSSWTLVKTVEQALAALSLGTVTEISLDHDLGGNGPNYTKTGYDVLVWIEEQVHTTSFNPPRMYIHSQNPVGKKKMVLAKHAIKEYCRNRTSNP